jgi:hypothetical protein
VVLDSAAAVAELVGEVRVAEVAEVEFELERVEPELARVVGAAEEEVVADAVADDELVAVAELAVLVALAMVELPLAPGGGGRGVLNAQIASCILTACPGVKCVMHESNE